MTQEEYMSLALSLAREAAEKGEVPVGCVVASGDGRVVGRGRNRREELKNAAAHAEMQAIEEACRTLGDWRLSDCSIYVTLEPCPMCAGAILGARIKNLCFGAKEPISGSCGSVINLFMESYGYSPAIVGGILEEECAAVMRDFFRRRREGDLPPVSFGTDNWNK